MSDITVPSSDGDLLTKRPSDRKFVIGMLIPLFIVFIIGIAIPLFLAFYISLTNSNPSQYIEIPPSKWLDNFFSFLNPGQRWNRQFYQYFYQTVFFVIASVSLELLLGLIFALIVNRAFKGRGLVRAALLVPWALPTIVSAIVFRELFAPVELFGLFNEVLKTLGQNPVIFYSDPGFNFGTFSLPVPLSSFPFFEFKNFTFSYGMLTIILVEIWKTTPFMALLILAALQTVPEDLYKAADIEGASVWQKFRYITLPMIKGPVIIAILFRLIDAIRVYDVVVVFRDTTVQSITVVAFDAWLAGSYGVSSAIAIFELLMIAFFAVLIFKLDKNRLLFGAVAVLFLFDRIITLFFELTNLLINDPLILWLVFFVIFIWVLNKYGLLLILKLNKWVLLSLGMIIIVISSIFVIFFSEELETVIGNTIVSIIDISAIIMENFVLVWITFLILSLFWTFRNRKELFFKINRNYVILYYLLLGILSSILFFDSSIFTPIIELFEDLLARFVIILLVGILALQIFLIFKSNLDIAVKQKRTKFYFYFIIILSLSLQIFTLLLEILRLSDIPLPGFLLSLLPLQEAIQVVQPMLMFALTLGILISAGLFIYTFRLRSENTSDNSETYSSNITTSIATLILLELILYIFLAETVSIFYLFNFGFLLILFYINRGKIIIPFLNYKRIILFRDDPKNDKKISNSSQLGSSKSHFPDFTIRLRSFLYLSAFVIIEFFLFFLLSFMFFIFSNMLLFILGIYFFKRGQTGSIIKTDEFIISVNIKYLKRRQVLNKIGFSSLVFAMLIFTLGPFLWMINRSFRNPCRRVGLELDGSQYCFNQASAQNSFELSPFLDPSTFSLQSYDIVLNSATANLIQALINGLILSGLTAIFVIFIGSFVAAVLSKYKFPGERYLVLFIFSMSSLPPIIIIIPYLIQIIQLENILAPFNIQIRDFTLAGSLLEEFFKMFEFIPYLGPFLVNLVRSTNGSLLTLLVPYVAFNLPLGVFLIRSFFKEIPDELIKAAKVDGASNFQIFRKILLPLAKPGIFTTGLMVFIQAWNELLFARVFLLGKEDSFTVPLALLRFLVSPGALTAVPWISDLVLITGAVVATLPLVILVLILQKQIISGITAGAVKG